MRKQLFNFKIMILVGFAITVLVSGLIFTGPGVSAEPPPPNFENNTNLKKPEPVQKIQPQYILPIDLAPPLTYPDNLPPAEQKGPQGSPSADPGKSPGVNTQPQNPQRPLSPRGAPQAPSADIYLWPPAADADIWQSSPNTNFGGDTEMWIGDLDRDRVIVRWDLASVPAKAMIQDAFAWLNLNNYSGTTNPDIAAHAVAAAWTETGVTWNNRQSGTAWTNPGGDYSSTIEDITNVGTTAGNWFYWYVADLVAEWHSGNVGNNGLLFKATDTGLSSIRKFKTKEFGSSVPELDVTYINGPVALTAYTPFSWWVPSPDWYTEDHQGFWEGVAIRPNPNADYDVLLYSDSNYSNLLDSSTYGPGEYDLIMVDGNTAPKGIYYPKAVQYGGRGSYQVEFAAYNTDVQPGTYGPYTMTPDQVIRVWDAWMTAGVGYYYTVRPTSGDGDLALRIYQSNNGSTANTCPSNYCNRGEYLDLEDSYTSGMEIMGPTQITTNNDWLGLVVVNTGATTNTSYNLYIDTNPPVSGSVSINNGAACTTSANVSLALNASDPETGIGWMRIANTSDFAGVSWETYNSSKNWTLTSGAGSKTVYVQYANNAGIYNTTDIFTDTISVAASCSATTKLSVPFSWKAASGSMAKPCFAGNNYCEPNNSRAAAIGPLALGYAYQSYPNDLEDFFYVTLYGTGNLKAEVTNYQGTGQLLIYDVNSVLLGQYGGGGATMTVNLTNLPAGKYYIRVYTSAGQTANNLYTLKVTY